MVAAGTFSGNRPLLFTIAQNNILPRVERDPFQTTGNKEARSGMPGGL
jgi:hypothetical protein